MTPDQLAEHRLLSPLTADERRRVASLCEPLELPVGAALERRGEPSDGLDLLLEGRALVTLWVGDEPHEVAVLGPGSWVGEFAMLHPDRPSRADVQALTEVRLARVPPSRRRRLLAVDAVHLQLDAVARRRRATNRSLELLPIPAGTVDGKPLHLRPLWPEDWRQYAANRSLVSDESLRFRFFSLPALNEDAYRRFAATDHRDQFAWGAFLDGRLVGVGRHALQIEDRSVAELAVLVADELHGRGIGSRLVGAIAAAASVHGARRLWALARTDNAGVRALLERFGATWSRGGSPGTIEARWPVADALAVDRHPELVVAAREVAEEVLAEVLEW